MLIAVCGTGTAVGKTHVSAAIAYAVRSKGRRCASLKPVESGGGADSLVLSQASEFHVKPPPPYQFADPVSPHRAARMSGVEISVARIVAWVAAASAGADVTCVETAGGLFTPLAPATANADLIRALAPDAIVVVALDRLGVLHDVRALLLAAEAVGLCDLRFALSAPEEPDASTGTNATELARLGICEISAEFPRAPAEAQQSILAAHRLLDAVPRPRPRG